MIQSIQEWENKERKNILKGKQLIHQSEILKYKMSRVYDDVDNKSKLPLLKTKEEPKDAVKNTNISKGTHLASGNNCCLCAIAYDLRRRGFDVISKQKAPINLLYDVGPEDVSWIYKRAEIVKTGSVNNLKKQLKTQPNGARGACFCTWKEGSGGHVVNYEIENNRPIIYDAQSGKRYDRVEDIFDNVKNTSFIRLDNIEPNYNFAKIAIE